MDAILDINGINKRFGGLQAVDNVSFCVPQGSITAVIGPNGAGKSTLFNLVSGGIPADSGVVHFAGRQIQGSKPFEVAQLGLARTYQHTKLFAGMTALENVMVGRHVRSKAGFVAGMFHMPWCWAEERSIKERALETMEFVGIGALANTDALSLSFGQQRLLELARALALEPKVLLLDEPAAGLNMHETKGLSDLIMRIRQRGVTVLVVEHDMSLVMNISDEVVVLSSGVKIAQGTPLAIQKNPEVVRVYLGEDDA